MSEARSHGAGRIGWIDMARALGACAIVLLHVFVSTNLAISLSTSRQVAYTVVGIVCCRWVVPAFFMLSGALMLDPERDMSWGRVWKHVRRMLLVIATFGTAFAAIEEVWVRLRDGMEIGVGIVAVIVRDVLTMQTWDHMWFVYSLTIVYLLVPAIRAVYTKFGDRGHTVLTLVLFVVALVIPTLTGGPAIFGPISALFWNVAAGCACFCVGGCLRRLELSPALLALGVGSAVIMVVVSISGIGTGAGDRGFIFLQNSCFACVYAVCILLLLRWGVGVYPLDEDGLLWKLAHESFGIYLIHPAFIHVGLLIVGQALMIPVLYELGFSAAVLALSLATSRLLRLIPLFDAIL